MSEEKNIKETTKKAWSIAFVMARLFPLISITCLIWYFIDQDITLIWSKLHLIITAVFSIPFILIRFGYLNEP